MTADELRAAVERDAAAVSGALEEAFSRSVPHKGCDGLFSAMRYTAGSGGKRIRPFLTLSFCRLYGGGDEAAMPFALAVECVHTYSLIHDDLPCMDNDSVRRGLPANHIKFGEATALLAGDGLLTFAFELCAANKAVSDDAVRKAVSVLASCAGPGGMVGGQALDLLPKRSDLDTLLLTHRLKTSCLIRAACCLGAIAAGHETTAAVQYGEALGLAYQITDDLLDAGRDGDENSVLNYVAADQARKMADEYTAAAVGAVAGEEGSGVLCTLAESLAGRKN